MKQKKQKWTEKALQEAIMVLLRSRGCKVDRVNTTGVWDPVKKLFRKPHNITVGFPDLVGCTKQGRYICVEVKSSGKKPTLDQVRFLESVRSRNGLAFWFDNFEEAAPALLEALGEKVGER